MKTRLIAIAAVLVLTGCASTYTAPDFDSYSGSHETVAVLPFRVYGDGDGREYALMLQRALYVRFLEGAERGQYSVQFQDVDETNGMLDGFHDRMPKKDIAGLLGVDAVVSGKVSATKPMGAGQSIAAALLLGSAKSNEVWITVTVHDGKTGSLVWSYDHAMSGGVFSTPDQLSRRLIGAAGYSFPYRKRR